ncbi:MAG: hypothetical protein ACSLFP_01295 [Acidimicrobiales bacterium]
MSATLRQGPSSVARWVVGLALAAAYLPAVFLGYGTDIDVANVLRAGASALDGDYEWSRPPGAIVHETATVLLDRVGGSVLVNLASLAFAALALWMVARLVRQDGARWPGLVVLVLATNPWFWIAATSLGDFVWAIALVLSGIHAARQDQRTVAGLLFGLAIGCRASSLLLALAWLVAERTGHADRRPPWADTRRTAAVTVALGTLCFVPAFVAADLTFGFLDGETDFAGFGVHLGRWAVKNVAVMGVPAGLVLLVGLRRVVGGALARWSASPVVRFAVLATVVMQLLFFRLPFKPLHLLPVVVAVVLLIGASPLVSRRWLVALLVAQLLGGIVTTTLGAPDVAHDADSGRLQLGVTEGPVLNDVQCRLEDRREGPWPDASDPEQFPAAVDRAGRRFDCQIQTWRADAG